MTLNPCKEPTMPKTTVVRYKTHPQHAEENAALVQAVFQALQRARPAGLRYQCLRGLDGVTFTHLATIDAHEVHPLTSLPEFQAFLSGLRTRCAEPPALVDSELLGRYENQQVGVSPERPDVDPVPARSS
jgi:hypothetical protein